MPAFTLDSFDTPPGLRDDLPEPEAGPGQLGRLAGLLADGTLAVPIQAGYPLAEAGQALADLTGRHTQGKLAITLP